METPTSESTPVLPGDTRPVASVGDPAPSEAPGSAAYASEGEASPLARARDARIVDGMIDLTPIREFAYALPDRAGVNEHLNNQLEELSAILFHILFRTRTRVSEDWFAAHPEPQSPKPRKEKPSTDDLLADL